MSTASPESRWRIVPGPGKTGAGKETNCIRCISCEAICSFNKERRVSPAMSRIRVETKEIDWLEGKTNQIVSHKICRHCPGVTPCMKACPVEGAIVRDAEWGTVLIDEAKCDRCQECITACPFDAAWYDEANNKVIKCDLCGGKPQCVEWCPVGVLKFSKSSAKGVNRGE